MSNGMQLNQSNVFAGLGTMTFTVVTAGIYTVAVQAFLPYQASGSSADSSVTTGGSDVTILVKQGATTKMTLEDPAPTQATLAGTVRLSCAAEDVITVVLSSSAAADNQLNSVKTIVNLYQGE